MGKILVKNDSPCYKEDVTGYLDVLKMSTYVLLMYRLNLILTEIVWVACCMCCYGYLLGWTWFRLAKIYLAAGENVILDDWKVVWTTFLMLYVRRIKLFSFLSFVLCKMPNNLFWHALVGLKGQIPLKAPGNLDKRTHNCSLAHQTRFIYSWCWPWERWFCYKYYEADSRNVITPSS